ncbi:MAG: hypothetical protein H6810_06690 [Phycisphaeraceae bacterium]|nr:MAG: hypothetical protein H6810_06690 [Phycisphaeraceae bacterium]
MRRITTLLALAALSPLAHADTFVYAAEDGGNSDSSLSQFDANVTWGNTFFAEPGFERIVTVRLALAQTFDDAARPIEVLIYDDPDDGAAEFDPARAVLISRTTTTAIPTPDGEPADYPIEPTVVEGRFFVAVNMDAFQNEPVFSQDFFEPGDSSWTFYNPVGTPQLDLGASLFIGNNIDFGVGTWVVRAVGCPPSPGCNAADIAEPFGVLDLQDVQAFVAGFVAGDPIADLTGNGVLDLQDVQLFVSSFVAGCP